MSLLADIVMSSVETVNAAATAIVTAETRTQPSTVQKKRRGRWWSLYSCFGSYKNKRVGHGVILSEPSSQRIVAPPAETQNRSSTVMLPFIAPPSSPAYFIQSATQSPAGLHSVHACSPTRISIGPYAHETELVSPPVFSTFTTEPSTAPFTPPPESGQMTTPSSPEVPFAQLLSSSLARNKRNYGMHLKYPLSQYEYLPYQYPGGHIISPGSELSNSGTCSPFRDKRSIIEFRLGEVPKAIGYEYFSKCKWGSRFGSDSITPNGLRSRLGSGTLTPNGGFSRLGSGTLTPNGGFSRLGSGALTPNGLEPPPQGNNHISEVSPLADSDQIDRRVSFELNREEIPSCILKEPISLCMMTTSIISDAISGVTNQKDSTTKNESSSIGSDREVEGCNLKQGTISLGSSKDFNFKNAKGEEISDPEKSIINCEWWTSDKIVKQDVSNPPNSWTFFPILHAGVS